MAISFLFWNIDKKTGFEAEIAQLCNRHDIMPDILQLAESANVDDDEIERLTELKRVKAKGDWHETALTPRFYSKLSFDEFQLFEIHETSRVVFAKLNKDGFEEIIICGLHMPSKLEVSERTQYSDSRRIASFIRDLKARKEFTHNRIIVFGDFNMNPFEPGMIEPDGFNAVLSTVEALNEQRTEWYKQWDYFYNPMWSFLGDRNYETGDLKLPGSYYFRKTRNVTLTFWNIYDTVIIRPSLISLFNFASLKILEFNGIEKLVDENYKIKDMAFSDHLPLTFKINI